MRILFVNSAPLIKYGIGQAFADQGDEVLFVFLDEEESILPFLQNFRPDFVFNDGGINRFNKIFPYIEDCQIPHVYWAIEDPVSFNGLSLSYAPKSSHIFTPCLESISDYINHGYDAHLLMFACHPYFHRTALAEDRFRHDVVFVGNNYGNHPARMRGINDIIRALVDNNYDIKIYGNEWWLDGNQPYSISPYHYGGILANEDLPKVCASAKIVLGLHSVDSSYTMMSMRTFEILGAGGFYLTQWTPAIEHHFINHHHLVWTKSSAETFELVNWYLEHPEERARIARNGQAEVYEKHTYHQRINSIRHLLPQSSARLYNIPYSPLTGPLAFSSPPPIREAPASRGIVRAGRNRVLINL